MNNRKIKILLISILAFAFFLRISGMFFGLLSGDVYGDEIGNTIAAFKIMEAKSPVFVFGMKNYLPPLFSYLLVPAYGLIGIFGMIFHVFASIADFKEFVILYKEWFLAPSRILSAIFGMGTVYLVYLFARKLFDEKIALFSAFLLAVDFLHLHESQIGHIWSPITFFTVFCAYSFFNLYLTGERKWYFFSAAALGLGYAIGQLPIIFYPFFVLAHYFYVKKIREKFLNKKFIEANIWLIALLFVFTLLNFYTIYKHFYDVILAVLEIVGLGDFAVSIFPRTIPGIAHSFSLVGNWVYAAKTLFYDSPVFFTAAFFGGFFLLKKNKFSAQNVFLLFFPVYNLIVFSFLFYNFTYRYVLPLVPFIAIIVSFFVFYASDNLFAGTKKAFALPLLMLAVSSYSMAASLPYSFLLTKPYTVDEAVVWVYENVPSGNRVVSDVYLNSNRESLEFLKEYNQFNWLDTRKNYLLGLNDAEYPRPNYFLIDTNLTDVFSLPQKEKRADYALVFFYEEKDKKEKIKIVETFGKSELAAFFYPKEGGEFTKSLLNIRPHFFLKNILETRQIGPNVEIYKFLK
ncbi:MAG: glycosyltransferase family 39 protein [Candidatus Pacebacteria bacterium]|nr:glycosyltransferase family 39 protein [Candidatus Paceibacterota bacterium]